MKFESGSKLGHVGSKTRSVGQILEKPYVHSRGHSFEPKFREVEGAYWFGLSIRLPIRLSLHLYVRNTWQLRNSRTAYARILKLYMWYLDEILNIDNNFFDSMVNRIYPSELQLNKASVSDAKASFLDLHLSIWDGFVKTKIYDKRDDFDIVNFPFLKW